MGFFSVVNRVLLLFMLPLTLVHLYLLFVIRSNCLNSVLLKQALAAKNITDFYL